MAHPFDIVKDLWHREGLPDAALDRLTLTGTDPVFPSSFAVGAAAQSTLAAAALAACELGHARGAPRQAVAVDMAHAAAESTGHFRLDGVTPNLWDPITGLYPCADGFVRIHANFAHHRDGALRLLGLAPGATRHDTQAALRDWAARDVETAAAAQGLVITALRSFAQWDATPQGHAIASQPLISLTRLDDAPALPLPPLSSDARPLDGIRVLDLTRILAGPVGGRTLAALGADVMLLNSPRLPNIEAIADTSRGKRSALVDLRTPQGQAAMDALIGNAHVVSQGYRPGGLTDLGFGPHAVAARRPGIVYVSLTAYGTQGPWAGRRGFDSLVQTAMGFNHAEGDMAHGGSPRPLPMQILDQATGYLMAFGASAALLRQQQEGGSWHVQVSLAQTGHWLRGLGRIADGLDAEAPDLTPWLSTTISGFGALTAVRPAMQLGRKPTGFVRPSMRPGTHPPSW